MGREAAGRQQAPQRGQQVGVPREEQRRRQAKHPLREVLYRRSASACGVAVICMRAPMQVVHLHVCSFPDLKATVFSGDAKNKCRARGWKMKVMARPARRSVKASPYCNAIHLTLQCLPKRLCRNKACCTVSMALTCERHLWMNAAPCVPMLIELPIIGQPGTCGAFAGACLAARRRWITKAMANERATTETYANMKYFPLHSLSKKLDPRASTAACKTHVRCAH